ncbi:MAG: hypothetical protein U9R75_06065 [Candidatus Thermoplasmatota archaeon]|nr:hypothetical protein [Candidatus Thermoplasmatota archaeon]
MKGKIFIVHRDKKEGREITESLTALGFDVHYESENGGRAFRTIKETEPDMIMVYLTRRHDTNTRTTGSVYNDFTLSDIPMFFIGGDGNKVSDFKEQFRDARFMEESQLVGALTEILNGKWA